MNKAIILLLLALVLVATAQCYGEDYYDSEDFYGEDDDPQTTALETLKTLETRNKNQTTSTAI